MGVPSPGRTERAGVRADGVEAVEAAEPVEAAGPGWVEVVLTGADGGTAAALSGGAADVVLVGAVPVAVSR